MSSSDTSACVGAYKIVTHSAEGVHETLLLVEFSDLATYKTWASGRKSVERVVAELGDEAFLGPKGSAEPTILCLRSGTRAVRLSAAPAGDDIDEEKLRAIAGMVLSRM